VFDYLVNVALEDGEAACEDGVRREDEVVDPHGVDAVGVLVEIQGLMTSH